MNTNRFAKTALMVLLLALMTYAARAASDIYFGPTGTETGVNNTDGLWQNDWGPAFASITFDTNSIPLTGDVQGSINVQGNWTNDTGGMDNYNVVVDGNNYYHNGSPIYNGLDYSQLDFDIKYDTNSTITPNSAAHLEIDIDSFYNKTALTVMDFSSASTNSDGKWHHITIPIASNQTGISGAYGVGFYEWNPGGTSGTMNYWVANVHLTARIVPIPPPTLIAPSKSTPGLNCIATTGGVAGQYDRYHVCTVNDTGYSFYGQSNVTYTWNVEKFPTVNTTDWQQHVFFVGGAPGPFDQAADYNLASCIFMTIQQNAAGSATFNFRYKTNEPGGNGMLFNTFDKNNGITYPVAGSPTQPAASLTDSHGAVGTWSINFNNSSNVTLTSPTGLTTNFVFDPASAALFADPMTICVGGQPNGTNDGGELVVVGSFSATGVLSPISDNFSADTALDTNTWKNLSSDTNGCVLVPTNAAYQVAWNLPDTAFALQTTASLSGTPSWTGLSVEEITDNGNRVAFLNTSNLPSANVAFFELVKRTFYQLQVLLPGETAAPGTPTGKTGTPTTQNTTTPFNITINAVDANWYPISGVSDMVSISSTDSAFIPPANAPMVNGTVTLQGEFQTDGTWTVTATDVTQTNILSNTSSSVTVSN